MFDLFADDNKSGSGSGSGPSRPAGGAIVSRVKKLVPKPRPQLQSNGSAGSNGHVGGGGKSSNGSYTNGSGSSKSTLNRQSSDLKKQRLSNNGSGSSVKRSSSHLSKSATPTPTPSASASSTTKMKPNPRKEKRAPSPVSSESSEDAFDPPTKRLRLGTTQTQTPELGGDAEARERGERVGPKRQWTLDKVDERGEWGRGWSGFVPCEEVVRGKRRGFAGSIPGKGNELDKYVAWSSDEGFEKVEPLPSVDLVYPSGCREKFVLLSPTSQREYNPVQELRRALEKILNYYIPPSHQYIFGTSLVNSMEMTDRPKTSTPTPAATPVPTSIPASPLPTQNSDPAPAPSADAQPPSSLNLDVAATAATNSVEPSTSGTGSAVPQAIVPLLPQDTIADALRRALAPNRKDGPGLLRAMDRFNTAMEGLIQDGSLKRWMSTRERLGRVEWYGLMDVVHDQAYSRVVGPYANELEHHPKHPDEVAKAISAKEDSYGELSYRFMSRVIEQTKLGPNSTFVDLGSGVGNCVMQTALEAGCKSYGFELLPVPAHCARLQLQEVRRRWAMWGLNGNLDVEVHEGDFRDNPAVSRRLREADVVLVNNEVFPSSLNVELTQMFYDLKDGAIIVSLQPLVAQGFKMNETNCDTFDAIIRLTQHRYHEQWVSWKHDSGNYYLQVVDRSMRRKFEEEMTSRRRR